MVTREHRTRAAALLRIIAAYDGREYDDFIVTAFATGIAKYEHIPDTDWQAAITDWYLTPGVRRITVGDLCAAAVKTYRVRTKADTIGELEHSNKRVPKPAGFDQLVREMTIIVREFHAQGATPSNEDVLREWARRAQKAA